MHLNLSAISNSSAAGRLLRLPLRLLPSNAVLPILQGPLVRRRWIVGAGNHGYWLGSYEYANQRRFAESAGKSSAVFDIGAHVGFYTLLAAVSVRPGGHVFAFEPLAQNLSFLRRHVQLNTLSNVTVFPYAVSDRGGTVHFEEGANSSMGRIAEDGEEIVAVSLDEMFDAGTVSAPDLMKIDVEGSEAHVLAGAERLISSALPTIFLATHSAELNAWCLTWLTNRGYDITRTADDEIVAIARRRT
jgi:FkbM family methyltransferase